MTAPLGPPRPEDVAEAVHSGRAPHDLPGAALADRDRASVRPDDAAPARDAGAGTDRPVTAGGEPSDDGVGTTPSHLPPTAPGEDGYADPPDRHARLPEAPGLDDSPVTAGGVTVRTRGAALVAARETALRALVQDGVAAALAAKDATLWGPGAAVEASARLGWLDLPATSRTLLPRVEALREQLRAEGVDRVVLVGRGGAALAADAVARAAGVDLVLLDSADPGRVRAAAAEPGRTVVVLTPAGVNDAEGEAHRRVLRQAFLEAGLGEAEAARRWVAVADPGSALAGTAEREGFRAVLPAGGDGVGDRFAALTAAALVPAALAGADCGALLDDAAALLPALARDDGPGLALGAALGGAAVAGHDKVVLVPGEACPPGLAAWAAHLLGGVAGGPGRGLVPVAVEGPGAPGTERQADTHPLVLGGETEHGTAVAGGLGALLLLLEHGAAVAGRVLRVDPFAETEPAEPGPTPLDPGDETAVPALVDGPVQVHDEGGLLGDAADLPAALERLLEAARLGGHLAVVLHLDPGADAEAARLRPALARRLAHPVTATWASLPAPPAPAGGVDGAGGADRSDGTGRAGGRADGTAPAVLVVTGEAETDLPVPGGPGTFGGLQRARAAAEQRALAAAGRPVLGLHLTDRRAGLRRLLDAVDR